MMREEQLPRIPMAVALVAEMLAIIPLPKSA